MPEALDRAFPDTGARVALRDAEPADPDGNGDDAGETAEIADVVAKHDAFFSRTMSTPSCSHRRLSRFRALIPERSFYVTSFAKCLAPGLRIGAMIAPEQFRDRSINAVRATGWMASPIMAEVVARLIHSGDMLRQVHAKRAAAARRNAIADRMLGAWLTPMTEAPGFHRWLPIPPAAR